ncbi:type I pullulanase [Paenibacillus medicaginis]|uniref:pullulanase n=1 Tax=Paenibacillus medicaginis TaxID=1470560 RepID=A0ABV5C3W3_9BACL
MQVGNEASLIPVYNGRDLGLTYTKDDCLFNIWAPTAEHVTLALYEDAGEYDEHGNVTDHSGGREFPLTRNEYGVWSLKLQGDWNGYFYMYLVTLPGREPHYAADPYSIAVSANGQRSAIVDLAETDPAGWENDVRPHHGEPLDAVIYELHVRDFSSDPEAPYGGGRGGFRAFLQTGLKDTQGNSIGIDHLQELGVTHVHLMPVPDYKTVNELAVAAGDRSVYNWGYDPQHYNVPEGSYASDPADPAARIREFKQVVQTLHAAGIGVIMDVVYNHTFSVDDGPFEPIVPGYFYRTDEQGRLTNGSGVGNELATERPMVRKFIKDSLRFWAEEYHVDGFRFDLLGLIDTPTVEEFTKELRSEVFPGMMIYGEPWTGGDSPLQHKTLKGAQRGKGFAVFNDNFRNAIKGDSDGWGTGFATGAWGKEDDVVQGIRGAIYDFTEVPSETINYVTAHDNLNLWDKIITTRHMRHACSFPEWNQGMPADGRSAAEAVESADPYHRVNGDDLLKEESVRRSLLANSMVLTSQGIPFIHAGDELLRSKYGDHNSYRSGDEVNAIRWGNKARFLPVFRYYQGLIALRRSHPAFRMRTREQVERHLEILRASDHVVAFRLHGYANGDDWRNIVVIYNGSDRDETMFLPDDSERWHIVVNDCQAGAETLSIAEGDRVTIPRWSMMVLHDDADDALSDEGGNTGSKMPGAGEQTGHFRTVEMYYQRTDGQYEGWNVWVWGTGVQDGHVPLTMIGEGLAVARIRVAPHVRKIGYIFRLNQWEDKDIDMDRYLELGGGNETVQVIIRSGTVTVQAV